MKIAQFCIEIATISMLIADLYMVIKMIRRK